jgi:hypothetical protein
MRSSLPLAITLYARLQRLICALVNQFKSPRSEVSLYFLKSGSLPDFAA